MCTQKMRTLSYIGAEKITFPPEPDIQTDIKTSGRTLAFIELLRYQEEMTILQINFEHDIVHVHTLIVDKNT